eukprot:GHVU01129544.1.p2 GENE.GHVU01129544.1~~GHVU01129544.1.p2  ORF type:complete len:124 (+),score=28.05 GHVU01129544.1:812-1183(+)
MDAGENKATPCPSSSSLLFPPPPPAFLAPAPRPSPCYVISSHFFSLSFAPAADPSQMFGALKSQFAFLALNGGLGLIISFFFSGFLVGSFSPSSSNCRRLLQQGHSSSIVAAAVVVMAVLLLW